MTRRLSQICHPTVVNGLSGEPIRRPTRGADSLRAQQEAADDIHQVCLRVRVRRRHGDLHGLRSRCSRLRPRSGSEACTVRSPFVTGWSGAISDGKWRLSPRDYTGEICILAHVAVPRPEAALVGEDPKAAVIVIDMKTGQVPASCLRPCRIACDTEYLHRRRPRAASLGLMREPRSSWSLPASHASAARLGPLRGCE